MLWDSINIANENWLRRHDAKVLKHFSQSMDRNPHFPRNSEPQAALARLYGMLLSLVRKCVAILQRGLERFEVLADFRFEFYLRRWFAVRLVWQNEAERS